MIKKVVGLEKEAFEELYHIFENTLKEGIENAKEEGDERSIRHYENWLEDLVDIVDDYMTELFDDTGKFSYQKALKKHYEVVSTQEGEIDFLAMIGN